MSIRGDEQEADVFDLRRELPPFVYVPCVAPSTDAEAEPMRTEVPAGRALLVYTALDRLWRVHGPDHDWAVLHLPGLEELREQHGFEALLIDEGLEPGERWMRPS